MPYIDKNTRKALDNGQAPICAGDLNYKLTKLCLDYLYPTLSYRTLNEVIGALECCKQEMYRRVVAPYEDKKAEINGDVYE